jgi:uracil-DNA glycosylase
MNAREQLRIYLEQRKEAGESELVLDQLEVEDLLRLVGATQPAAKLPTPGNPMARQDPAGGARSPIADQRPTATPGAGHASSDWREVLRSSGAAPDSGSGKRDEGSATREAPGDRPHATPPVDPAPLASRSPLPAPGGLTVGGGARDFFGPMASLQSLEAVASAVASCTRCPLYATATNPVPGQGKSDASLMIVGEAPGATEDQQGLAFVGAAGQLLTKILEAVDLKREDVFICNVLKHRPPGNRNPLPDEVTACSPYLVRQFELIRPRAILALGTFAAQTLLQTKLSIGKLRSQVHRYHGVPLIVTYHPAALLRNPSWKRPTWEDVQLVRRILDSSVAQS